MNSPIRAIADIDEIFKKICMETPQERPLRADLMAAEAMAQLDSQYGKDASNVRSMLSYRKLTDMARHHLRRSYDPELTAEDAQLAFTQFGEDIQVRYPITVCDEEGERIEYQSPMHAPIDQLTGLAERDIKIGKTRVRRGRALLAFIAQYRV